MNHLLRRGTLLATVGAAIAVTGLAALCQHPKLSPPKNSLPPSRIVGIGINCHAEMLPVADLKAIGVSWVRLDEPGSNNTYDRIKPLVDYYRDFGQLWVLPQTVSDPAQVAETMVAAGATEIEVFNEPAFGKIPASDYVKAFQSVRKAVGSAARLYGPALCTWETYRYYLDECARLGFQPDVLTFHGYHQQTAEHLAEWVKEARSYGLPVVVSEVGFPNYLGPMAYRVKMTDSLGTLFVKTRDALKGTPWCWYDGPNPPGDYDCGLFDEGKPNENYRDVQAAIARDHG